MWVKASSLAFLYVPMVQPGGNVNPGTTKIQGECKSWWVRVRARNLGKVGLHTQVGSADSSESLLTIPYPGEAHGRLCFGEMIG